MEIKVFGLNGSNWFILPHINHMLVFHLNNVKIHKNGNCRLFIWIKVIFLINIVCLDVCQIITVVLINLIYQLLGSNGFDYILIQVVLECFF
eukprot:UN03580